MPVTLLCPRLTCRAVLTVPDNVRGKRVRCAECGITLIVPTLEESKGVPTVPSTAAGPGTAPKA